VVVAFCLILQQWFSKPGVGNLFCTADRFETDFFSRTGLQKPQLFFFITNIYYDSGKLLQL